MYLRSTITLLLLMTKADTGIIYAYSSGYRITEDGALLSPKKKALVSKVKRYRRLRRGVRSLMFYKVFNIYVPDYGLVTITCHRLAAYQKFTELILDKSKVVRHLNGNSLDNSLSNIGIGTQSDNMLDIPSTDRSKNAQKAGLTRRKFDDFTVTMIRRDRMSGMKYSDLCTKYSTSKSTLSYLFNNAHY